MCEFYVSDSYRFCHKEDFEDWELLSEALKLLGISRKELIQKMKAE